MGKDAIWSCDQHFLTDFISLYLKAYDKIWSKKVKWIQGKTSFDYDIKMTLDQSQEIALTLNTHILLSTYLAVCIYLCSGHRLQ